MCIDILYPKHCAVCGKTIFAYTDIALCSKCGAKRPVSKCIRDDRYWFDEALGAVKYSGFAKDAMLRYKFKSVRYYAKAYAHLMDMASSDRMYYRDAVICPVPLSKGREREYNQTALAARELAALWGGTYIEELLYKCREVSPLSKMKLEERRYNIKDAIDVNPCYNIYGKDILIIDDIFTSGTTTNECARVLKMYGARKVYVLCACYD